MLFSVEKAYIHSILQQRSIPLFYLKAYLTFFSGFILFLFPFLREFSCSCLTDRVAEHPNRFSPIFCCNLPRHCLFSMSMGFLRLPYFRRSESHLLFNTKFTQLMALYSFFSRMSAFSSSRVSNSEASLASSSSMAGTFLTDSLFSLTWNTAALPASSAEL